MINGIKDILLGFKKRRGLLILWISIVSRLLSFFASWIALQFIDNYKLGYVIYAYTIISFIIPIGGFGLHQSLIRYGALAKSNDEKNSLFLYVLKKGITGSFILMILVVMISFLFKDYFSTSRLYLIILSLAIPTTFLIEIIKIQFRLKYQNSQFAYLELIFNILLVITVFILSFFYKDIGYSIALVITPLIAALLFFNRLNLNLTSIKKADISKITFWKYGFFSSLSNVATQLLSTIDIILIGYLLYDSEMITYYKYVSLIPMSLLFLPRAFMATDFVYLTEKINDKKLTKKYINNYIILFGTLSIIIIMFSIILSKPILSIFGTGFSKYYNVFIILTIGVTGILILRGLFGNLLSSIGKAAINYRIALIALLLNVVSNYYLIPNYGIFGAALTSAILMWLTGIVSFLLFYRFYKISN